MPDRAKGEAAEMPPRSLFDAIATIYHGPIIPVRRELVPIAGGLIESVILSQMLYWSKYEPAPDAWMKRSAAEVERETTITARQQARAREELEARGLIETKVMGNPGTLHWRINWHALIDALASDRKEWSATPTGAEPKAKAARAPKMSQEERDRLEAEWLEFYLAYPRKIGKADARVVYMRRRKDHAHEEIMRGVKLYPFSEDPKYIPHPATWLNKRHFIIDEAEAAADQPDRYRPKMNLG